MDDSQMLESILLTGTPQEAAEFFKKHRDEINAGRTLAIACRFCGIEYVKALVESGAAFKIPLINEEIPEYWLAPLEFHGDQREVYRNFDEEDCFENKIERRLGDNSVETFYILPEERRAEAAKYLCENSERLNFEPGELLFFAITSNSQVITAKLREMGVTFTEIWIDALTNHLKITMFIVLIIMLTALGDDAFCDVIREVVKEVGGKRLCYAERYGFIEPSLFDDIEIRFYRPGFFEVFLENFRFRRNAREELLMNLIAKDRPEFLAQCAERSWLRQPKVRDEMIAYASEVKSTECLAWLLDYKNRSFDLAAERAKAEKRSEHELNAPHSIAALQKSWQWKRQEDGTLIITGYWGTDTVVNIPPKIGKRAVTAIDDRALLYKEMSKVVIPYGIRTIGDKAFADCGLLEEVIIPDSVVKIDKYAFAQCERLSEVTIPGSVKEIGESAFSLSSLRRAFVEPGSCAEEYCRQNNIPYEYIMEENNV